MFKLFKLGWFILSCRRKGINARLAWPDEMLTIAEYSTKTLCRWVTDGIKYRGQITQATYAIEVIEQDSATTITQVVVWLSVNLEAVKAIVDQRASVLMQQIKELELKQQAKDEECRQQREQTLGTRRQQGLCLFQTTGTDEYCNSTAIERGFCQKHAGLKCFCGQQAYTDCSAGTGLYCGRPVCGDPHFYCKAHGHF